MQRFLENGLAAINDLEKHLEDIDIQPKPEAQYVVYNRVPKVCPLPVHFRLTSGLLPVDVSPDKNEIFSVDLCQ